MNGNIGRPNDMLPNDEHLIRKLVAQLCNTRQFPQEAPAESTFATTVIVGFRPKPDIITLESMTKRDSSPPVKPVFFVDNRLVQVFSHTACAKLSDR